MLGAYGLESVTATLGVLWTTRTMPNKRERGARHFVLLVYHVALVHGTFNTALTHLMFAKSTRTQHIKSYTRILNQYIYLRLLLGTQSSKYVIFLLICRSLVILLHAVCATELIAPT